MLGISPPAGFSDIDYGALSKHVAAYCHLNGLTTEYREFCLPWNGVAYRVAGCEHHNDAYTTSCIAAGTMPKPLARSAQERELLCFFASALSAIETMCYAYYLMGQLTGNGLFPPTKRSPYAPAVATAFARGFPHEPITADLKSLTTHSHFLAVRRVRNTLSHQGTPGRTAGTPLGVAWAGLVIDNMTTQRLYAWLLPTIETSIKAGLAFASVHL